MKVLWKCFAKGMESQIYLIAEKWEVCNIQVTNTELFLPEKMLLGLD